MNSINRVLKNTLVLFISQGICLLAGLIYFVYMARYLGAHKFGTLSYALALTGMLSILTDVGLTQLTIREIARNKTLARKYLKNVVSAKIVLSILFFSIIYALANLASYSPEKKTVVFLIAVSVILNSFNQTYYSIFIAYEKMEYKSIGEIIYSIILLSGSVVIIHQRYGLTSFALLYVLSGLTVLIYAIIITTQKFIKPEKKLDQRFLRTMIKQALPFGFSTVFVSIYYQMDSVMLSMIEGDATVGIYNAAYRLIFTILIIRTIIHSSIFPLMARSYLDESRKEFENICENVFKYLFIIIFPIAVGTTILADQIIDMIYGAEYKGSVIALQILIWSTVIIFINSYPRLFEVANQQIIFTKLSALGAFINMILNFILIPFWSYAGAAFATVCTEVIMLIVSYKLATPKIYDIRKSKFPKASLSIILSGIIMGTFTIYLSNQNIGINIIASSIIYVCMIHITGAINYFEIMLLKKIKSNT